MGNEDPFRSSVANFNRDFLISGVPISRIGRGELGGKAQGLVFIRDVLKAELHANDFPEINIGIPSLLVICTGVFDAFMERNNLSKLTLTDIPDDRIAHAFQRADLPFEVLGDLRALIEQVHTPLAIRSSSLLEDARHEPFAGIYATKMIPNNQHDPDTRFHKLVEAIKFVYASTFFKAAKNYRRATGHRDEDEKMAVIIQEVVGKRYADRFYPELSGVARSHNYYPVKPAKPEDGVVNLALGLGKIIVDSGISWPYSPAYPKVEPPFGSVENLLENTQNEFWVVNMGEPSEYDPTKETEYLLLENFTAADHDDALRYLASTYDPHSGRLFIGTPSKGPRALTFAPILILQEIPLNHLMISLLTICQKALGQPVEIEFAMTFNPHRFGFLQVRTMVAPEEDVHISNIEFGGEKALAACDSALGNGVIDTIRDIVYIKPENFSLRDTRKIVPELAQYNQKLLESQRSYLLIALGRLGTTDPWLGIPIDWSNVSGAKVILEVSQQNVKVELSQGTHYFHNLINLGVKYFSLPFSSQYTVDWKWLSEQSVVEESRFIRHVRLSQPLRVKVDGRSSRGVILKS
ncbi:MAG: PEP/pyruvate-binding domain-containing protein [Anaerolineales bacterium]